MSIAIIGAGLGGMTAALALARLGQNVTVYEQAPQLGDVGAGISLTPNASKVLEYLDMRPFLEAEAQQPLVNFTNHYKTRDVLIDLQRKDCRAEYGAPYYQIHRAELHAELVNMVETVRPGSVHTGHELSHITPDGALQFSNGKRVAHDLVIAADGLRSTVRRQLFDPAAPTFTGQIAYRGLVPTELVTPQWHGDYSTNLIGPGAVFLTYPLRKGRLVNFVGLAKTEEWVDEGWSTPATRAEILRRYEGWHESLIEVVSAAPAEGLRKWGLFGHKPLETFINGKVVLIGDAAHPLLPFMGQGAAMAIEDAMILARCIAEFGPGEPATSLYERLRKARVFSVQAESARGGERVQAADPDKLTRTTVVNEDTLGIFHYDAAHMSLAA